MKINFVKIFDWSIEKLEAPKKRYICGVLKGWVVRVKYVYHGRRSYAFNLPRNCDLAFSLVPPKIAACKCYEKLKTKMEGQHKNNAMSR